MTGINRRFFQVKVGSKVTRGDRRFEITHVLAVNRVLAVDLETKASEQLYIDEIQLLSEDSPGAVATRPEARDPRQYENKNWKEAEHRLRVITPLLEKPFRDRAEVERLAKAEGRNAATIYRWLKKFTEEGTVGALLPANRGRKTGERFLKDEQELVIATVIEEMYLSKQRHKQSDIVEEVQRRCRRSHIDSPTRNTIRNRMAAIHPAHTLRRRGFRDQARNRFEPILGEFPDAKFPLAVVQIDHTQADIIVVDEVHRQPIGRPWVTIAIDVYSRMVAGFYLGFDSPSATSAGMCLAHAICKKREYLAEIGVEGEWPVWGFMHAVHADNGTEFHGNTLKRACEEHAIDLHWRAIPKPHWGGHIERMMGNLANELRKLPGTTFSNPTQRRGYDSEGEAVLTIKELERHLVDFIVNIYHQRLHSEIGMPPKQRWEIGVLGDEHTPGTGIIDFLDSPQRIRLDFLPYFTRTIQQYGIQIDNISYYDPVLDPYINAMDPEHKKEKRTFIIRRDPRDISKVYFLDPKDSRYSVIPYRNIGLPAISVRELHEVQRILRERGENSVDEATIFAAIERMRSRVDEAKLKSKAARRQIARRPKVAEADAVSTQATVPKVKPAVARVPAATRATVATAILDAEDPFSVDIKPFDTIDLNR
jgi:putative transposase